MGLNGVAIIGGSRGIGLALAEHFLGLGLPVAVLSQTEPERSVSSRTAWIQGDVTDPERLDRVADWLGGIAPGRLVVITAAAFGPVGPITSVDLDRWAHTIQINLAGAANVLGRLMPGLRAQDRIVFFLGGGVGGPRMQPRATAYTTSKMGLAALIEAVARDPECGVPVIGLAPGAFPTDFTKEALAVDPAVAGADLRSQVTTARAAVFDISRVVASLDTLMGSPGTLLSGRCLAAQRDDLQGAADLAQESTDLFRMRRVDGESVVVQETW